MGKRLPTAMRAVLVFVVMLLLSAMATGGAHPAFAQGNTPIRIGFSIALTGGLSVNGKTGLLARQIWRDDINARGGILGRPVELVFYDDQSSATTTPGIYSKLIDVDKVDILYAPYGSVTQAPVLPMAKQRELLIFGNFSTWANEQLKYERYFHIGPYGPMSGDSWGGFTRLAGRKGLKTLAILVADNEGTIYFGESNRRVAKQLGLTVVYDQRYPMNTVEFSSMLRAINATKPDAVYIATFPNESIAVMNGIDEVGVSDSVKLFGGGMIGLQTAPLLERLGPRVNGIVNFNFYVPSKTMDFPGIREYFDRYYAKAKAANIDVLGYYFSPYNYAMGQVIEQAVKATKTLDNKVLAKYMHEQEFDTIVGKFRFGPTGEWTTSRIVLSQFQGVKGTDLEQFRRQGPYVILDPQELATGEPIMPFVEARKQR